MSLIRRNPAFSPLFPQWVNRFLNDDLFHKEGWQDNTPAVNIRESETDFAIEVAAPGLQKGDFKIEIKEDTLTISSEKKQEKEEKDEKGSYISREFGYSYFQRSFHLPKNVESENISAKYVDGVLHLSIPKKKEVSNTKTIEIG